MKIDPILFKGEDENLVQQVSEAIFVNSADTFIVSMQMDWLVESMTHLQARALPQSHFHSIYGGQVSDMESLCYPLSRSFPREYPIRADAHALYDLVLGFETKPDHRIILWHDSEKSYRADPAFFLRAASTLLTAAFLNRNGLGTTKANGRPYLVNQCCVFGFLSQDQSSSEMNDLIGSIYAEIIQNGPLIPELKRSVMEQMFQILIIQ